MSESLNQHIAKAESFLHNARLIAASPMPSEAISQAYYAFFGLVRGLLAEKDIFTKSHSGARTMFALHCLRTGDIPASFGTDLAVLYDRRQLVDYVTWTETFPPTRSFI